MARIAPPDAQRKANTIRYLRYLSAEDNENPIKYVWFYQMAFDSAPRHRSFDKEKCRLAKNTDLFAGPSSVQDSTNYPGDRKIYGSEDTITIQLHHIEFDGAALDFPRRGSAGEYQADEQAVVPRLRWRVSGR